MRGFPLVSVVIPTYRRPQWVVCAVRSALSQSYAPLEVIVVVDGPDCETVCALEEIHDARLRSIMLDENAGGSEARNVGVRAASGEWVAFLDDDDQWVSEKLEKQMQAAANVQAEYPIVSSRLRAQDNNGSRVLPRRLYRTGENVADYLFCRDGFSYGDGMLQTSTLLMKRRLLLEVPFTKGLKRHQDWDWLLRAASRSGVEIVMLPEALTLMRAEGEGVSRTADWKASFAWAKLARPRMSARAYSFFIATECVPRARKSGAGMGTYLRLFWELVRNGQPDAKPLAIFLSFCVFPEQFRKMLRRWMGRVASTDPWREYKPT